MPLTNTNTINTRIQLKYDTYENWLTSTLEILPGEMCVALVFLAQNENTGDTLEENGQQVAYKPTILIKVGDGIKIEDQETHEQRYKYFKELDYVQTKAGDIYGWAKSENPPDATQLYMDNAKVGNDKQTIAKAINDLEIAASGVNTNTIFRIAYNEETCQIRLEKRDGTVSSANWEVVELPTAEQYEETVDTNNVGGWINLGASVALDDSIVISGNEIGVQVSSSLNNALSLRTTSGEKGLYVPRTYFTENSPQTIQGAHTVNVVTGISTTANQNSFNINRTNLYTKEGIDALINPGMEFKGVETPENLDTLPLKSDMVGNSYKLSKAGSNSLITSVLRNTRPGDLAIVCEDSSQSPPTYYWDIVPAGDESVVDSYRPIAVDGIEVIDKSDTSGYLNVVQGFGINVTPRNLDINDNPLTINDTPSTELLFEIDTDSIATAASVQALQTHTGGLGSYINNGNTVNHTVKSYVDQKVAAIDVANLTQNSTYLIFDCGDADGWSS